MIAAGLPVVSTDLSSVRDLQARGAGVALVPAADPDQFRSVVQELLADRTRLGSLKAANLAYSAEHGSRAFAAILTDKIRQLVERGTGGQNE
jgi:glycosyltransferase involved in cell wall biosynthesis